MEDKKYILRGKPKKPIDPINILLRHWLKIIVFGSIAFMALIPLAMHFNNPYYETTGKIRIAPVVSTFISQGDDSSITGYYHDYVRTQVDRIKSPKIIEKAINMLDPINKKIYVGNNVSYLQAVTLLSQRLAVFPIRETHIIQLYLKGSKPEGLAEIINNIIKVYLEKIDNEEAGTDNQRLVYLQQERDVLEKKIATQTLILHEIAEKASTSSFEEQHNILTRQLQDLQEAYTRAYSTRIEKENIYKYIVHEVEALKKLPIDSMVNEMMAKDESIWDTISWSYKTEAPQISQLTLNVQELHVLLDKKAQDDPERKPIEDQITAMTLRLTKLENDMKERAKNIVFQKRNSELNIKLIEAESAFNASKETEDELLAEKERVRHESSLISQLILKGQGIDQNLKHMHGILRKLIDRISELKLESRAPGRVTLENNAMVPVRPAGSNKKKLVGAFFVLSYGVIAGIIILLDLLDNRVRSPKDIVNAIGALPSWPISDYCLTGSANTCFARVTIDDPINVVSKAIRSLSIKLDKERIENKAQIATFTGVDSQSGVTEILLNTAYAMTKLCKNVLIIETNFIQPGMKYLFKNYNNKNGLVNMLNKNLPISDCIYKDIERKIDILFAGDQPSLNELANFDHLKFNQLLQSLKDKYDFILIDSAPILINDFTEYLMLNTDIGAIIVQGDRSLYNNLYRAIEVLSRLQLHVIVSVLNWGAPRNRSKSKIITSAILNLLQRRISKKSQNKLIVNHSTKQV